MHRHLGMLALASMAGLLAITGCDDDEDEEEFFPDAGVDAAVPEDEAFVRAIHLSPNAPTVDIFVSGIDTPAIQDLEFTESTEFLALPAGTFDFAVAPTGSPIEDAVLTVEDVELAAGVSHTAVALGELPDIQALLLVDDFSEVPAGLVRVRAIHAAAALGEVDVFNLTGTGDLQPLFTDVEFGEVSDYIEVPAGTFTLAVDVDNDLTPDAIFPLPAIDAGVVANVFAVTDAAGTPFLLAQLPDGTTVRIDPQ